MIRSWLVYLLLLLLDTLVWLSIDGYIYHLLLRVLLMLPLLSLLLFLVGCRTAQLQIEVHKEGCTLRMPSRILLLVCSRIQVSAAWHNCFYGTDEAVIVEMDASTKKLLLPDLGSGEYNLQLQAIQIRDLLGLFRRTIQWRKDASFFHLPHPAAVNPAAYQRVLEESRQRPVGVPGSDYELKEHHEGEPIRRIHYQASYRLKKTMVREFEKEAAAYLHLHLRFPQDRAACERILAVCCGFCLKASPQETLQISWQSANGLQQVELQHPHDMEKFLRTLLSVPRFCEASSDTSDGLTLDESFAACFEEEAAV